MKILEACSKAVELEFEDRLDPQWAGSPFEWIREHQPIPRHRIGMRLFATWCAAHEISTSGLGSPHAEKAVGATRIDAKFAMLSKDQGYTFNQIRQGDYTHCVLFGIRPHEADCWVVPMNVLWANTGKQHGDETQMLKMDPNSPPAWLSPYGGDPTTALGLLQKL